MTLPNLPAPHNGRHQALRAATLLIGLGCTATQTGGLGPGNPVVAIDVSPSSALLAPGASADFSAVRRMQDGTTSPTSVTWSATGGAISPTTGHYIAGTLAGIYRVIGFDVSTTLADTAVVAISSAPPPPIVAIDITPSAVSLGTGGTVDFSAAARRSDGTTGSIAVTWSSTGGTISPAGHYVAGSTPGTFSVIATDQSGIFQDTAAVTISAAPPPFIAIDVSPPTVALLGGATADFSAVGRRSDGSTGPITVTWSATGGSISSGGHYTAGTTAGSFQATATEAGGTLTGTAAITLTLAFIAIDVTPPSATLNTGDSVDFTAVGRRADASTGPISVTWTATGGTISAAGHYIAGPTPGSYQATATELGGSLVGAAPVSVSQGPAVLLLQEDFETTNFSAKGWYDNTNLPTSTIEHAPGGTRSLEASWGVGALKPFGSGRHLFTPSASVYLSYWVKYSANWVGSGVNYHPHEFQLVTNEDGVFIGPSATHLTTYVEHNYQNGGIPFLFSQDALNIDTTRIGQDLSAITEARAAAGCNGNTDGYSTQCYQSGGWFNGKGWKPPGNQVYFSPTPGPNYKNDWHHVEAYFQLNSIQGGKGQLDGVAQYWFDGQLAIDHHNVLFRTGLHPTMKFNQFLIAPYIGVGSPVAQSMWVDDLTIMTAHP